jgi:glycosyltransferase involved in cell wall biosynthesis
MTMADLPPGPKMLGLVGDASGCTLWRVWHPFTRLREAGYPAWWDYQDRSQTAGHIPGMDAVLMPRLSWNPGDEILGARWRNRVHSEGAAIIADWDDDLFSPEIVSRQLRTGDDRDPAELEAHRQSRLYAIREIADGITVTTETLAEVVRGFTDRPVLVVPNAIDLGWWFEVQQGQADGTAQPTIGWIGGRRPDRDAEQFAPAWSRVARRHPGALFVVQGHAPPSLLRAVPEDQLVELPWLPLELYPFGYTAVEIGCCPLAEETFNLSKSPIKAFEFGASNAVVLASPTVYGEVLRSGETGWICRTTDDWETAIEDMIARPQRRAEMAARWTAEIDAKYSLEANLHRWPEAWTRLVAKAKLGPWRALEGLPA